MQLSMRIPAIRPRDQRRGQLLVVRWIRSARATRTWSGDSTATGAVQEARSLAVDFRVGGGRSHWRGHRAPAWNRQSRKLLTQVKDTTTGWSNTRKIKIIKLELATLKSTETRDFNISYHNYNIIKGIGKAKPHF